MSRPIRPQLVASAWPPSLPRARVRMRHDGSSGRNEPGSSTRLDSQRPEAHAAGVDKSVIARGEDLIGHTVATQGQGQGFAHRSSRGPGNEKGGDAEAGVIIQTGHDLQFSSVGQAYPAHDVHLPEFHGTAPFPAPVVLPAPAPLLGINEPMTDETPVDGRATGKRNGALAGEVIMNGARAPAGMSPTHFQHPGYHLGPHLMGAGRRPR